MARSIRDAGWDGVGIPPEGNGSEHPRRKERLVAQSFEEVNDPISSPTCTPMGE